MRPDLAYKNIKIIGYDDCPRCNAIAELRPEEKGEEILITYLVCSKCKFKKFIGFTTWTAITNNIMIKKLETLLNSTNSRLIQAALRARIDRLKYLNRMKELGL